MKKSILIIIYILVNFALLRAEGIRFELNKSWNVVVEKAKKENKLIFIDCYTSWCGPCKMLSEKVFVKQEVGDWFNTRFVNVKYDMEKDADGIAMQKKYAVKSYPTLLFIDPLSEKIVHRLVGFRDVEVLIKEAKNACDPGNSLAALKERYMTGDRDTVFLTNYIFALEKAGQRDSLRKVVLTYLDLLTDRQLVTSKNWILLNDFVSDPLSRPFHYFASHYKLFYQLAERDCVDSKLINTINNAVANLISLETWSTECVNALKSYLLTLNHFSASSALARLYAAEAVHRGNYAELLQVMREAFKYNLFNTVGGDHFFRMGMNWMLACNDTILLQDAIEWIDVRYKQITNNFEKQALGELKKKLSAKL